MQDKEKGEEMMSEEQNRSWLKWIAVIVLGVLVVGGVWGVERYWRMKAERLERKAEAQMRYARHLELEKNEEYNPGWTGEGVVKNLREALEADPENYEVRTKLAQVLNERRGHYDNMLEEHCRVLEGGLDYLEGYEPKQRQKLIRGISRRCQEQIYPELELGELQQMWIDHAPYTNEAIRRQLGRASAKAKQGTEDALEYIEQTGQRVKEHARRTGSDPERKLVYLEFLRVYLYQHNEEYDKALEHMEKIQRILNEELPQGDLPEHVSFPNLKNLRHGLLCQLGRHDQLREEMVDKLKKWLGADVSEWPEKSQKRYENPCSEVK
ncbi:MAG: hypothetical protein ACLFN5_04570 [bacterium]